MGRKRVFNLWVIICLLGLTISTFGCGKDDKKPSQFTPLLQDLSNWDNTKTRLMKRQDNIVIPIINQMEAFSKIDEQEKQDKANEYLLKINKLAEALPNSNEVIKKEGHYTEYANRYVKSARALLEIYKNKQNQKNIVNLKTVQRNLLDAKLGIENAYAISQGKNTTYNFTKDTVAKINKEMTYEEVVGLLRMPGLHTSQYVLHGDKTNTAMEACVWSSDEKYLLVKFKEEKVVEIVNKGL